MPKFLAGCHCNEEKISRHSKKEKRILAGPNEWQQVCNRSNPEKTGRSCEGVDFSWLSSKVSRTLVRTWYKANNIIHRRDAWGQPKLSPESKWTYLLWMVSWYINEGQCDMGQEDKKHLLEENIVSL